MNWLVKPWKWFERAVRESAEREQARRAIWRQQRLVLHASDVPPAELQQAPPRKVRLTREGLLFEFLAAILITFPLVPVYLNHIVDQAKIENTRFVQKERIKLERIQDPIKRHQRENWVRRIELDSDERFSKGTTAARQLTWMLTAYPLLYALGLTMELRQMRLLKKGFLARGTVVRLPWHRRAVVSFFDADGKEFCIKTTSAWGFECGNKVWLLYLPNRPKVAWVYNLPRQPLKRIVSG